MNEHSHFPNDSVINHTLRPGVYRHYKGRDYEVFGLVRHSETEEWLVHYRTLYGDHSHWVRPYRMFIEQIEVDGEPVPRFDYLGPCSGPSHFSSTPEASENAADGLPSSASLPDQQQPDETQS